MKNLKVWQKLTVMGVVFMIPFAVVTWRLVSSVNTLGVEFARKEARGADYYAPLLTFLQELQQRRGLASALLNGEAGLRERLAAKSADVEKAAQAVTAADQRLGEDLKTTAKWNELKQATNDLLAAPAGTAADSFQRHTKVIDGTVAFIALVGDNSNLTLDPDLDSYYLMDLLVFKGPVLADFLGQARGLGAGIAAAGRATPEQLARLTELATLADYLAAQADGSLGKAIEQNAALAPAFAALRRTSDTAVREALVLLRRTVADGGTKLAAADYFAELTRRIDPLFQTCQRADTELLVLLDARVTKLHRSVWLTLGFSGLGLVLVSAIGVYIIRDITRPLAQMVAAAGDIATGRLPEIAADPRRDELGDLARAFARMSVTLRELAAAARQIAEGDVAVAVRPQSADDVMGGALAEMVGQLREVSGVAAQIADGNLTVAVRPRSARDALGHALVAMVQRLSTLVGQVQKTSIQVNASATEIAATARQQQTTATEIAATTTEIGATAHEIAATSRELVKTVGEVAQTAGQTGRIADEGRTGLARMEQTMTHVTAAVGTISGKLAVLSQKAGNISSVVTTIAKVADQTNLLSLNAAIEAEKAGEFGRGFAVVAQEVRRLADQTAVASSDIGDMVREMQSAVSTGVMGMDKFSDDVRRAVDEVRTVGAQLAQIIEQVQALTPRFASVNEGMQAQATGAQQISEALAQLGDAARQTAESLRQSTDAIQSLNDATGGLRAGIERFKVAN